MNKIYVALDIETTGLRIETDEIIEIGAIKFREGEIIDTFQTFLRPAFPVPYKITALTGIKQSDVARAPSLTNVSADLVRFVKNFPIVGHSIDFDLNFLAQKGLVIRSNSYDTFELATLLLPQSPVYNLGAIARQLGVNNTVQHRALADCEMTMHVFNHFLTKLRELPIETLGEVVRATNGVPWSLRPLFVDILGEQSRDAFNLSGSTLRSALSAKGLDDTDLDLMLHANNERIPPLEPKGEKVPVDLDNVGALLGPDGPFAELFPGYEHRPQQIEMSKAVGAALNENKTLLVEAGTGTGKSIAYLLPAIEFAVLNNQRVVVSTNTINLQDQLFFKDIPDLQRIMQKDPAVADPNLITISRRKRPDDPPPFRSVLLKGRHNYICLKRWFNFRHNANLTPAEIRTMVKILLWLPTTERGDKAELLLINDEEQVWDKLAVTEDSCVASKCHYNQKGQCFYYRGRRDAESAHVIVVNHSLLLSDVAANNQVLPEYKYLVVDEAHHLEDEATSQLGFNVTETNLLEHLDRLSAKRGSERYDGFLVDIPTHFRGSNVAKTTSNEIENIIARLHEVIFDARADAIKLFTCLYEFLEAMNEEGSNRGGSGYQGQNQARGGNNNRQASGAAQNIHYDIRVRLTPRLRNQQEWKGVIECSDNVGRRMMILENELSKLVTIFMDLENEGILEYDQLLLSLQSVVQLTNSLRTQLNLIVLTPSDDGIYWISASGRSEGLSLHSAPLHIGLLLEEHLFRTKEAVVLTSATMSTEGEFSYIRERLSLGEETRELHVGSPYDYQTSTLLYLNDALPEPNKPGYQRGMEQALLELCQATNGRALVLFTSHAVLKQTYRAIQRPLEDQGILVLGHGIDGSRRQLLDRFRHTSRIVLLGTSSFWEGVDVSGDALSVLVITKLPFAVPNDPIFAARSELFDDAFLQYSVPQTVLKFKQGFGRLIRSNSDRGVVAVLDRRLTSKGYGRIFVESLPDCTVRRGPTESMVSDTVEWLKRKG